MRAFYDPILNKLRQKDASSSGGGINPVVVELDPVISYTNTPPGAPVSGDRYLINTAPTGAWVGKATQIAEWNGAAWVYTVPVLDDYVFVTDTLLTYRFNGTAWVVSVGTAILQNGNRFGVTGVRIGTNDNAPVYFKSNGLIKARLDTSDFRLDGSLYVGIAGVTSAPTARLQVRGSGATSATYALKVDNSAVSPLLYVRNDGNIGVGTSSIFDAKFNVISLTEQVRVGYDIDNYFKTTVSSAGAVTNLAVGTGSSWSFNYTGTSNYFAINETSGGKYLRLYSDSGGYASIQTSSTGIGLSSNSGEVVLGRITAGRTLLWAVSRDMYLSTNGGGNAMILLAANNAGVGVGQNLPHASAVLDANSGTQGFLPPRMTTAQKNAISAPAAGLMVYDTTLNKACLFTTGWETVTSI